MFIDLLMYFIFCTTIVLCIIIIIPLSLSLSLSLYLYLSLSLSLSLSPFPLPLPSLFLSLSPFSLSFSLPLLYFNRRNKCLYNIIWIMLFLHTKHLYGNIYITYSRNHAIKILVYCNKEVMK